MRILIQNCPSECRGAANICTPSPSSDSRRELFRISLRLKSSYIVFISIRFSSYHPCHFMSFFIISICCKVMQNAGRASPFTEAKASRMFCSSACILETNSQWSDGDQVFIPKRPKHSCLAVLRMRCWQLVHTFKPLKQIEFLGLTHFVALKVLKKSFRKSSLLPSAWQHFGALKRFGTCHVEGQMTTPFLFPQLRFIKVHDPVEKDQPILRPCHPAAVSSPCSIGIYIRKV